MSKEIDKSRFSRLCGGCRFRYVSENKNPCRRCSRLSKDFYWKEEKT
jgi:hypothetical protein